MISYDNGARRGRRGQLLGRLRLRRPRRGVRLGGHGDRRAARRTTRDESTRSAAGVRPDGPPRHRALRPARTPRSWPPSRRGPAGRPTPSSTGDDARAGAGDRPGAASSRSRPAAPSPVRDTDRVRRWREHAARSPWRSAPRWSSPTCPRRAGRRIHAPRLRGGDLGLDAPGHRRAGRATRRGRRFSSMTGYVRGTLSRHRGRRRAARDRRAVDPGRPAARHPAAQPARHRAGRAAACRSGRSRRHRRRCG